MENIFKFYNLQINKKIKIFFFLISKTLYIYFFLKAQFDLIKRAKGSKPFIY